MKRLLDFAIGALLLLGLLWPRRRREPYDENREGGV